jgi:hypothetical protein
MQIDVEAPGTNQRFSENDNVRLPEARTISTKHGQSEAIRDKAMKIWFLGKSALAYTTQQWAHNTTTGQSAFHHKDLT